MVMKRAFRYCRNAAAAIVTTYIVTIGLTTTPFECSLALTLIIGMVKAYRHHCRSAIDDAEKKKEESKYFKVGVVHVKPTFCIAHKTVDDTQQATGNFFDNIISPIVVPVKGETYNGVNLNKKFEGDKVWVGLYHWTTVDDGFVSNNKLKTLPLDH